MIVITGEKGIGKTTLLRKVVEESKRDFYGVISDRFEKGYYVEDLKTGEKRILCSENGPGLKFRRFFFNVESLQFVIDSLGREGDILVYDEIGYLEMEGILDIFCYIREPGVVIVRKELVDAFSSRVDAEIFEVNQENRDQLHRIILARIEKW
ncbi:MAG: nucleoside-triphosphatase [Candidatus Methanofastidiosia archaeon]